MNRALNVLATIAGMSLVCVGFYLTGVIAVYVDHRAIGLTAQEALAPQMFLAWGLPALVLWAAAGYLITQHPVRYSFLSALVEVVVLVAFGLLTSTSPTVNHDLVAESAALFAALFWPILFAAVLSPVAASIGSKLRTRAYFAAE